MLRPTLAGNLPAAFARRAGLPALRRRRIGAFSSARLPGYDGKVKDCPRSAAGEKETE